ncbi:hypothetical protein AURDEDRAFT_176455 [Auricularia subglabra TFB-10046 SS5]|uniref:Uncharacterized protein n=1 Tax=Auricularia subglabra (strain TFB-10046 / SS5) TaxID=717982 RepID=J0D6M3_AURST|nr:hypothetical protein AURDEDRAFT_176455 [Auricularia subglabra TFB-10046 SS5]
MTTLWRSIMMDFPPVRLYFAGDPRRNIDYSVIDSIYHVYALHVLTFGDKRAFGDTNCGAWDTYAREVTGALAYFFMSGWMLPSVTSSHPGWEAAKRRASAAVAEAFGEMQSQHGILGDPDLTAVEDTLRALGRDVPAQETMQARREKRLRHAYCGLVAAGIELQRCGPSITIPRPASWTQEMVDPCFIGHGAHRDSIFVHLHKFVEHSGPEDREYQHELFMISCELARGQMRYDTSRLERLKERLWNARWVDGPEEGMAA